MKNTYTLKGFDADARAHMMRKVMKCAWRIAHTGSTKFGGSPRDYISESMKEAYMLVFMRQRSMDSDIMKDMADILSEYSEPIAKSHLVACLEARGHIITGRPDMCMKVSKVLKAWCSVKQDELGTGLWSLKSLHRLVSDTLYTPYAITRDILDRVAHNRVCAYMAKHPSEHRHFCILYKTFAEDVDAKEHIVRVQCLLFDDKKCLDTLDKLAAYVYDKRFFSACTVYQDMKAMDDSDIWLAYGCYVFNTKGTGVEHSEYHSQASVARAALQQYTEDERVQGRKEYSKMNGAGA